jgi:nucleoside-diphosphate kinase
MVFLFTSIYIMTKYEQTLVLIKHDGVARGLIGEIISRFERVGLKIVGMKLVVPSIDVATKHYPSSEEWLLNVGNRVIEEYTANGVDINKAFNTLNPKKIGEVIKSWNVEYLTFGPVVAIVLEGPGSVKLVRKMVGTTNPSESAPGTIRGDYTWDSGEVSNKHNRPFYNLIHASSSVVDAKIEINLWFSKSEIAEYELSKHSSMGWSGKLKK